MGSLEGTEKQRSNFLKKKEHKSQRSFKEEMEKKLEELSDCIFVKAKRQENNVTSDSSQVAVATAIDASSSESTRAKSARETQAKRVLEQLSLQDPVISLLLSGDSACAESTTET